VGLQVPIQHFTVKYFSTRRAGARYASGPENRHGVPQQRQYFEAAAGKAADPSRPGRRRASTFVAIKREGGGEGARSTTSARAGGRSSYSLTAKPTLNRLEACVSRTAHVFIGFAVHPPEPAVAACRSLGSQGPVKTLLSSLKTRLSPFIFSWQQRLAGPSTLTGFTGPIPRSTNYAAHDVEASRRSGRACQKSASACRSPVSSAQCPSTSQRQPGRHRGYHRVSNSASPTRHLPQLPAQATRARTTCPLRAPVIDTP